MVPAETNPNSPKDPAQIGSFEVNGTLANTQFSLSADRSAEELIGNVSGLVEDQITVATIKKKLFGAFPSFGFFGEAGLSGEVVRDYANLVTAMRRVRAEVQASAGEGTAELTSTGADSVAKVQSSLPKMPAKLDVVGDTGVPAQNEDHKREVA